MDEDDSQLAAINEATLDHDYEKLEEFYDDFHRPLLEPQPPGRPFSQEKYSYKQILGIRVILLPLLVIFVSLAAWINSKAPHCEFQSPVTFHH
jgi:hypothetical protein